MPQVGECHHIWNLYAAEGQSFFEFGRERIRTNAKGNSYNKNWQIGVYNDLFIGALFGFQVEDPYPEINSEASVYRVLKAHDLITRSWLHRDQSRP